MGRREKKERRRREKRDQGQQKKDSRKNEERRRSTLRVLPAGTRLTVYRRFNIISVRRVIRPQWQFTRDWVRANRYLTRRVESNRLKLFDFKSNTERIVTRTVESNRLKRFDSK